MKGPSSPLQLILIAALSPSNGIGQGGTLPWKLSAEMAYFRRVTTSVPASDPALRNAVIMGRNTWNSIPQRFRPLKGRVNVVISGKADAAELGIDAEQDTHLFRTLPEAVAFLQTRKSSTSSLPALHKTFLIGGAQLYAHTHSLYGGSSSSSSSGDAEGHRQHARLEHMLLTRIHAPAFEDCDVFLEEFRTEEQIRDDHARCTARTSSANVTGGAGDPLLQPAWRLADRAEMVELLHYSEGETGPPAGIQEEKGVQYEYQLWVGA